MLVASIGSIAATGALQRVGVRALLVALALVTVAAIGSTAIAAPILARVTIDRTAAEALRPQTTATLRVAPAAWLALLIASALCAWEAAHFTGTAHATALALIPLAALLGTPAIAFLVTGRDAWARRVETASGLWSIGTYLILGAGPFALRWFGR